MRTHLLFDFDGTLVDSLAIGLKAMNTVGSRHGYKQIQPEELDELMKVPARDRFRRYGVSMMKLPGLAMEFYREYRESMKELALFQGVSEMLDTLSQAGYHMSILSSNHPENIESFMEKQNINCFQQIITSNRLFGKDRMIRRYMRNHKIQQNQLVYIGDELRDIEACKKAEVPIIWVSYGFDPEALAVTAEPEHMAGSPEEVARIILQGT